MRPSIGEESLTGRASYVSMASAGNCARLAETSKLFRRDRYMRRLSLVGAPILLETDEHPTVERLSVANRIAAKTSSPICFSIVLRSPETVSG